MFTAALTFESEQFSAFVSVRCRVLFAALLASPLPSNWNRVSLWMLSRAATDIAAVHSSAEKAAARLAEHGFVRTRAAPLGSGFFSSVYEAKCIAATGPFKAGDLVAIKEIESASDTKTREHEISALMASQTFPNCIKCLKVFTDSVSGRLCLVFEHCAGGDLAAFLRTRTRSIDEKLLTGWFVQLLEALVAMEQKGVTHDDIALRNVLLVSADDLTAVRLADFGIARFAGAYGASYRQDYGSGCLAPEVTAGGKPSSPSDVWSLGCVMLQLLSRVSECISNALRDSDSMTTESKGDSKGSSSKPLSAQARLDAAIASACRDSKYSAAMRDAVSNMLVIDPTQRCSASSVLATLKPTGDSTDCSAIAH
jgi:serine/threonine protein kinase